MGFYRPPIRFSTGTVTGSDPEGDSGVAVEASATKIIVDGQTRIDSRLDSVKITSGGVFSVDSPVGVSFIIDSSGRATFSMPVRTVSTADSPISVNSTDSMIIVDTGEGPVTVRLPNAGSIGDGRVFGIKDRGDGLTNPITVEAVGGSLIDNQGSLEADDNYSGVVVVSGGGNYWIM